MSIDLRSSETEPTLGNPGQSSSAHRTPFQSFKNKLPFRRNLTTPEMKLETVPTHGRFFDVAADIVGIKTGISNVYLIGAPGSSHWVLVDAGMPGSANTIIEAAEQRFGAHIPPSAIILTHGHFDHIGGLATLCDRWDVPIYAHILELPYLTGRSSYPPPDPSVGGGCMSLMSSLYPKKPIDLGHRVRPLPTDGHISQLPGWRWIHTPGHTAGHISLFRESDRTLIAGDAFVTVRAESLTANITLTPELNGPPMYFTPDWHASRESVQHLANLEPEVVATGHGIPLHGEIMREELHDLARNFELRAIPERGRYIREPAVADETGVISVPSVPSQMGRTAVWMFGSMAIGFALGMWLGPQGAMRSRRSMRWRDLF